MKDGGLAFPAQGLGQDGLPCMEAHSGMTIRQYYKAAALMAFDVIKWSSEIGKRSKGLATETDVARAMALTAALIADAMIAEDEEHEGKP